MKRALFISLLLVTVSQIINCQQQKEKGLSLAFYGVVMDASTFAPIPNSQIFINNSFNSVSGKDGSFAVQVMRNDTVRFSVLGYKPLIFLVGDTLSGREFNAGIFMQTDTMEIGEVIIIPRIINLRTEILGSQPLQSTEMENARFNMALTRYQGIAGQSSLGDPAANYEVIRQKQRIEAYEKGGIPSDRMIGLSPFLLVPAAYLLIHGLPESPPPLKPGLSKKELDQIFSKYFEKSKKE